MKSFVGVMIAAGVILCVPPVGHTDEIEIKFFGRTTFGGPIRGTYAYQWPAAPDYPGNPFFPTGYYPSSSYIEAFGGGQEVLAGPLYIGIGNDLLGYGPDGRDGWVFDHFRLGAQSGDFSVDWLLFDYTHSAVSSDALPRVPLALHRFAEYYGSSFGMSTSSTCVYGTITTAARVFRQGDDRWGGDPYAPSELSRFISFLESHPDDKDYQHLDTLKGLQAAGSINVTQKGCFFSSLAMAISSQGVEVPPGSLNSLAEFNGWLTEVTPKSLKGGGITGWSGTIPRFDGLNPKHEGLEEYLRWALNVQTRETTQKSEIIRSLNAGNTVMLNINNYGHWVAAIESYGVSSTRRARIKYSSVQAIG